MPKDGDLQGWLDNVAAHRGRRIRVVQHDFGPDSTPTGLTCVMQDCDYIFVDKSAGPSRRAVILSHEIAHMLLGHDGASGTSDLVSLVAPDLDPRLVERILHRESHSTDEETAAEEVATVLAVEHGRRVRAAELRANPISARLR